MEGRDGTAFHARQGFGLARFPTGAFFCDTNIALIIPPEDTGAGWMKRIILFSRYCRLFDRWGVDARDLG